MKLLMLLGGLIGFGIGFGFGSAQHAEWPTAIWRACVAAYVGGLLLRWWGGVWVKSLQAAHQQRLLAAEAPASPAAQARK